jgi:SpoIIAA-like
MGVGRWEHVNHGGTTVIDLIPGLPENVVGFVGKGEVTSDDYTGTLIPAIEAALADHDKIRLLYVLGKDFTGFSGGAMFEDGKVGMTHLGRWEKMAVVADEKWIRTAVEAVGYLIPGKIKTFTVAQEADASEWVTAD